MPFKRKRKEHLKKEKKLKKLIEKSDSDCESEHELSFYIDDRVKLMKEVIKILKPKKIMSMAPNSMRNNDITEINSILLEELLGISNKRLKYIFEGKNLDEESSTDSEAEKEPIDIISLDDISDDDFIIDVDADVATTTSSKRHKVKQEGKRKRIKKEKTDKNLTDATNLMSVLELLELQARARAIRSQLVLENTSKNKVIEVEQVKEESDNDDEVIIASPKRDEIVISSSESEEGECEEKEERIVEITEKASENGVNSCKETTAGVLEDKASDEDMEAEKIIETANGGDDSPKSMRVDESGNSVEKITDSVKSPEKRIVVIENIVLEEKKDESGASSKIEDANDGDGIIITVDQDDIDCIICD